MRIIKITVFILFALFICISRIEAQASFFNTNNLGNINIDDYSDQQPFSGLNKAAQSDVSESELYKLVEQNNFYNYQVKIEIVNKSSFAEKT
jgi:hypothetical protein